MVSFLWCLVMGGLTERIEGVCPVCGEPFSYIVVRGNKYVYIVHYRYVGGSRKLRACYLGNIKYVFPPGEFVSRVNPDLILKIVDNLLENIVNEYVFDMEKLYAILQKHLKRVKNRIASEIAGLG